MNPAESRITESAACGRQVPSMADVVMKAPVQPKMYTPTFRMAGETEAVIEIDGYIGGGFDFWTWEEDGKSARTFGKEVKQAGTVKTIRLPLNSPGGVVTEATQIYNILQGAKSRGIEVIIEVGATCMSAATLIACAGSKVITAANSIWMFHNPSTRAEGEAKDMRAAADALDTHKSAGITIYRARQSKLSDKDISALLDATTWYTGEEARDAGWADEVLGEPLPDVTMALDLTNLPLDTASDAVKQRLSILMTAAPEVEEPGNDIEPEQTAAPTIESLSEQLSAMTETVNALAALVETLVPDAPEEPEQVKAPEEPIVQVDRNSPVVKAIAKRAKAAGRDAEFEDEVAAGATITQLQQSFLGQPRKPAPTISTVSTTHTPKPEGGSEPRQLKPTDYYAARRAKLEGK